MEKSKKKLICIVGATASGKTGLGVDLAKRFDGEIVSADSRQIYRKLNIGTGKDLAEYVEVKYHLIDICNPGEGYTMFDWLAQAQSVLADIWSRNKTPIVVGGTGLYVQALIEGFKIEKSETGNPRSESQTANYTREELETKGREELAKILIDLDEEAFLNIDLNNPARSIRAIEKAQSSEKVTKHKPDFDYLLIGKEVKRDELYCKIDKRVEEWFQEGFYEEVDGLLEEGLSIEWLNKIGLEYRILANFIINNPECKTGAEFEEMEQRMQYAIHQYARRQLIWWRRFPVTWVKNVSLAEQLVNSFLFDNQKPSE